MKKILSFILAGVVALGLIGCSGVLHDMTAIDMSQLYLRGDMNNYGTTPLTAVGDGTYTVTFSATANPQSFGIATSDGSWTTCYRMEAAGSSTCVAYTEDEVASSTAKNLYTGGGMKNATIATTIGTDYTLTITPMSGYLSVSVKAGEAPKTCYAVVDNVATAMTLKSKGLYTYTVTAASASTSVGVLYDGTSYGLASALSLDTATTLTKNAKAATFATTADKNYLITVDATAEDGSVKMTVAEDIFNVYMVGAINYTTTNVWNKFDVVTDTMRAYTFKYAASMSANWGSPSDGVAFKVVKKADGWDACFQDAEITLGSWETSGVDGNVSVSGLTADVTYTVLADVTDQDHVKLTVIKGVPMFMVGAINYATDNVFTMCDVATADTQTYTFKYATSMSGNWGSPTDGVAFKITKGSGNWTALFQDATLTLGSDYVASGTDGNASVAGLTDGTTYVITLKTADDGSVTAKIAAK